MCDIFVFVMDICWWHLNLNTYLPVPADLSGDNLRGATPCTPRIKETHMGFGPANRLKATVVMLKNRADVMGQIDASSAEVDDRIGAKKGITSGTRLEPLLAAVVVTHLALPMVWSILLH